MANTPKLADSQPSCQQDSELINCREVPRVTAFWRSPVAASITSQDFFAIEAVGHELALARSQKAANVGANAPDNDEQQLGEDFISVCHQRTGVRWIDLVESDLDPMNYQWSHVKDGCGRKGASLDFYHEQQSLP
jgi:hypothetical protein